MKIKTVTIGIPAFNEEKNITALLKDILNQKALGFILQKIIVLSDGSTDNTVHLAKKIKSPLIKVINQHQRKGKAHGLNRLSKVSSSDILVVLDADIRVVDQNFLSLLISPLANEEADLSSADQKELSPTNYFSKILFLRAKLKNQIFLNYKNGQNFYTCHGQARAFSKRLYKSLNYHHSVGEDMYSYLYCLANGFKYKFVPETFSYYSLPLNYADHEKQSIRFTQAMEKIKEEFPQDSVHHDLKIPWAQVVFWTMIYFFKNPILITGNLFIYLHSLIKARSKNHLTDKWSISFSSKNFVHI